MPPVGDGVRKEAIENARLEKGRKGDRWFKLRTIQLVGGQLDEKERTVCRRKGALSPKKKQTTACWH